MNLEVLQSILVDEFEATHKDGVIDIPAGRRITLMVAFGRETLRIPKVRSVRLTKTYVAIVGETESIFVDGQQEFAIKAEADERRDDARPGFH